MLPLLGLLGLGAGALGQDWYNQDQNTKAQGTIRGLLGRAPETLGPDVMGPAAPGSGLMADPSDVRKQLEFAAGVMGMAPRQRGQAAQLFDTIMGRASQGALQREGWGRQEAAAALHETNVNRRWEVENARIEDHFGKQQANWREQFEQDKVKWGEQQAFEKLKFREQNALAWRNDARESAAAVRAAALDAFKLTGQATMPTGYERVIVPATDKAPARIVARPVAGTPDWVKGFDQVQGVETIVNNVALLRKQIEEHGTEHFGPNAATQAGLYSRIVASIGKLDALGTLQKSDLERLGDEIPNPSSLWRKPVSNDRIFAALDELTRQATAQQVAHSEQYAGWGFPMRSLEAPRGGEDAGRAAPPAGSIPIERGRSDYRGRGKAPYRQQGVQ